MLDKKATILLPTLALLSLLAPLAPRSAQGSPDQPGAPEIPRLVAAASTPEVSPDPALELVADRGFGEVGLAPAVGDDLPIGALALLGDAVYWVETGRTGKARLARMALSGPERRPELETRERDLVPTRSPMAWTLHAEGDRLVFWDSAHRALVRWDPATGTAEETPTGRVALSGAAVFQNGRILAASQTMRPLPGVGFEELGEQGLDDDRLLEIFFAFRGMAVFLLDSGFERPRPLLAMTREEEGDLLGPVDRTLNLHLVRLDPGRRRAAVFGFHRPGIVLLSQDGEILETVLAPTTGRPIREQEPLARVLEPGREAFFHSDVLLGGGEILVADSAAGKIWRRSLEGGAWSAVELPFAVMRMERSGDDLYLLGQGGRLARFRLP